MKFKAQKIPKKEITASDILAKFCFYFPQYKYHEAKKMPYRRIVAMLNVAEKERARLLRELTLIVAAPHTKRGSGVKNLITVYEKIIGE